MKRIFMCLCFVSCGIVAVAQDCPFSRPLCLVFDACAGIGGYTDDSFAIGEAGYAGAVDLSLHFNRDDIGEFATLHGATLGAQVVGTASSGWMPEYLTLKTGYRIGWNGTTTGWYYVSSGRPLMTEWGQNYLEAGPLCALRYDFLPGSGTFDYRYPGWGFFVGGGNLALSDKNAFTNHAGSTWNLWFAAWKMPAGRYYPAGSHGYSIEDSGWRLALWLDIGFCLI